MRSVLNKRVGRLSNNFQRVGAINNTHAGKEFEEAERVFPISN
jgi:hypothetical protein